MNRWMLFVLVATALGLSACGPQPQGSAGSQSSGTVLTLGAGGLQAADPDAIPVLHQIPDFKLVDDTGKVFTQEDLKGKAFVISFIFSSCAAACPAIVSHIQVLQGSLPEGAHMVSFTVDPDVDTPERLHRYAKQNHRVPGRWTLVTGEWNRLSDLAQKGFYLGGIQKKVHSPRFALVDPYGRLRGYYDSRESAEMAKLVRDIPKVLAEPPPPPEPEEPEEAEAPDAPEPKDGEPQP